jgi:hypothetical protein
VTICFKQDSWSKYKHHLCRGGFEYLHRDPTSRRRRGKGKSQIWDSKIWSRVPRDSDPRKTTLARASSIYKTETRPFVREGAPEKQDRNCQKVINMGLDTKTYWLTDRQSQCDFDFDFEVQTLNLRLTKLWLGQLWLMPVPSGSMQRTLISRHCSACWAEYSGLLETLTGAHQSAKCMWLWKFLTRMTT